MLWSTGKCENFMEICNYCKALGHPKIVIFNCCKICKHDNKKHLFVTFKQLFKCICSLARLISEIRLTLIILADILLRTLISYIYIHLLLLTHYCKVLLGHPAFVTIYCCVNMIKNVFLVTFN